MVMRDDMDKMRVLDDNKIVAAVGDAADRDQFCEFVEKNVTLYRMRTGIPLSTKAVAHWTRRQLATALRKGPYQTDMLIAGYDREGGVTERDDEDGGPSAAAGDTDLPDADGGGGAPSLYFMDYLASLKKLNFAVHGYASFFSYGILDKYYKENMTVEEAVELLRKCLFEIKKRLVINQARFMVRIVDRNGVRLLDTIEV
eukprot:CAMPEP_0119131972 /NCGR_PEP_ID=MMETSP1310-20130426/11059_1 /TAXON_ID=464262 /ORGANISM="Genus nov. species nov., Strain RCC2339" /LENGTH=199 /DNA_ID=CAMNT_0007122575 /DNA_START=252 /DNA_END=851 /DNA_ORIENTATION=+